MRRLLLCLLLSAGCSGGAAANVAGNYTLAFTSGANGCNFPNWTTGMSTTDVPVTLTQNGNMVSAQLGGVAGVYTNLVLGGDTFTGTASGGALMLTLFGTRAGSQGSCAYTVNATVAAAVVGDVISGTITYTDATNDNPSCGALTQCQSVQTFNGTRPPPAVP